MISVGNSLFSYITGIPLAGCQRIFKVMSILTHTFKGQRISLKFFFCFYGFQNFRSLSDESGIYFEGSYDTVNKDCKSYDMDELVEDN